MGSTRIKGTKLKLELGTPAVDHWADITEYELHPVEADADVVTFEDASQGDTYDYKLKLIAIQSLDEDSFWRYVWENSGDDVPVTLAPFGNETPTAAQPHFAGTVTIGPKPTLGGAAGKTPFTFEVEWDMVTGPTLIDS